MEILKASRKREEAGREVLRESVSKIIENVVERGDEALIEYNKKFDGCERRKIKVAAK